MADLEIHAMRDTHYDAVVALWQDSDGVGLRPVDDSRESVEAFLEFNSGLSAVALLNDELVGAVLCGTDGRRGYIHHLAVSATRRRRGIGKALLESVLGSLDEIGIRKTSIDVFVTNEGAVEFWVSAGFELRSDIHRFSFAHPEK